MIEPHGGTLINRILGDAERKAWLTKGATLPALDIDAWTLTDIEMIGNGGFSPLEGFMTQADYDGVVSKMRLASGVVWSIPVVLAVAKEQAASLKPGTDVLLRYDGSPVAVLHLEDAYTPDKSKEVENVFRTSDDAHPGVARVKKIGAVYLGGKISVIHPPKHDDFIEERLTPAQTRAVFKERGWDTVVAFQTRNPIHRAHEYLTKCALEMTDGLLIHPLVGETKPGDIPADVRMKCYRVLIDGYYPKDRVVLSVLPASMRYGGPREAIFHALMRKNYGCSHFIVGRDHAGVGSYYGTYDAQKIFDEFKADEIGIIPLKFEHTFYCKKSGGMASSKTTNSDPAQRVFLSGTKVREMLSRGELPPAEFTRPEVAKVLIEAMRQTADAR